MKVESLEIARAINCELCVQFQIPKLGENKADRKDSSFKVDCTLREKGGSVIDKLLSPKKADIVMAIDRNPEDPTEDPVLICSATKTECKFVRPINQSDLKVERSFPVILQREYYVPVRNID